MKNIIITSDMESDMQETVTAVLEAEIRRNKELLQHLESLSRMIRMNIIYNPMVEEMIQQVTTHIFLLETIKQTSEHPTSDENNR